MIEPLRPKDKNGESVANDDRDRLQNENNVKCDNSFVTWHGFVFVTVPLNHFSAACWQIELAVF